MTKWHGGKGSSPRPIEDRKQFEDNWDRIFNKSKDEGNKESAEEVYDQTTGSLHEKGFTYKKS